MLLTEKAGKNELKTMSKIGLEEKKEKIKEEEEEQQEKNEEKIITFDINSLIFLIESEYSEEILKNSEAVNHK